MLLALVDRLRCTGSHAESWLVVRADVVDDARLVRGVLGCPVCRVEREVRNGVILWTPEATVPSPGTAAPDPDDAAIMRVGALIAFADAAEPYVLCGALAGTAPGLAGLADAPLVLLDPPDDRAAAVATVIRGAPAVPFATGAVRGIALDGAFGSAAQIGSAVTALARGGRLVAPADVAVPAGIRELARDAGHWVGERGADVVALGRAGPRA